MAKVHKQKARTDIYAKGVYVKDAKTKSGKRRDRSQPEDENDYIIIQKGQDYYSWQLHGRAKQISATYPKPQQLTQSDFLISIYDIQDEIDALSDIDTPGELRDAVENIIDQIHELADEQDEKRNNMPDSLQDSPTGELLQGRYDSLQDMIMELEGIDLDDYDGDENDDEAIQEWLSDKVHELGSITYPGE